MLPINPATLAQFTPTYGEFSRRLNAVVEHIGVESQTALKDYRAMLRQVFNESAVGLTEEERDILTIMLAEEAANKRFSGNKWLAKDRGGDTAEHPIFISLQIDKLRDMAGFGPAKWDQLKPEIQMEVAKLSQALHVRAPLHDSGELVDIAADIARELHCTKKEPDEEALVGPYKIMLATYALAQGDQPHYTSAIRQARKWVQQKEQELLANARAGAISGDDYVNGVGREIAAVIGEQTQELLREMNLPSPAPTGDAMADLMAAQKTMRQKLPEPYRAALDGLTETFAGTQKIEGYTEWMFHLMDKLEGDAHFRHFAGLPSRPKAAASPSLRERFFPHNEPLDYSLVSGSEIAFAIRYSQKAIVNTLREAEALPPGPQHDVALAFARAGAADVLRNHIRILQKAPHALDLTNDSAKVARTAEPAAQDAAIATRHGAARDAKARWAEQRQARGFAPITEIDPERVATRELIAVLDKAANAIETGRYRPTREEMIPIGQGKLPAALQVTQQEALESSQRYPLQQTGISGTRAAI